MTEAVVVPLSTYPLTGISTGPFPTSWGYEAASEVQVWIVSADGVQTLLESGTDYTLTPGATTLTDGGSVTLAVGAVPGGGWTSGDKAAIARNTPVGQPEPLGNRAAITPSTVEETINRVVRQGQDVRRDLDLSIKVPLGEPGLSVPAAAARAGKLPVFADGALGLLAPAERLIATDAEGKAYGLPLVQALNEIGVVFTDYGPLDPTETQIDDYGAIF